MKPKERVVFDGMRAEYDFDYAKGVRGKYYARIKKEGTNVVLLDPDVAKAFPNSASVNKALRSLLKGKTARRSSAGRAGRKRAAA
jgi:hypothetical protein